MRRGVRAQGPPDRRRADLAEARELHRERRRRASADAIALMAEARRRAREQFGVELEHEVQFLGPLELPPLAVGEPARRSETGRVAPRRTSDRARARRRPARRRVVGPSRLLPSPRSLAVGSLLVARSRPARYVGARETSVFAVRELDVAAPRRRPRGRGARRRWRRESDGASLARRPRRDRRPASRRIPAVRRVSSTARSRTRSRRRAARSGRCAVAAPREARRWLVAASGRVLRPVRTRRELAAARLGAEGDAGQAGRDARLRTRRRASPRLAPRRRRLPGARRGRPRGGRDELTLVLASGLELRLGDAGDLALKLAVARAILRAQASRRGGSAYLDVSVPERPVLAAEPSTRR